MNYEAGFVILLVAWLAAKIIAEKALRELSTEQKGVLVEAFSGFRVYGLIPIVAIIIGFIAAQKYNLISYKVLVPGYFLALFVFLVVTSFFTHKKFKTLGLPDKYVKKFLFSRLVMYTGLCIFTAGILAKYV